MIKVYCHMAGTENVCPPFCIKKTTKLRYLFHRVIKMIYIFQHTCRGEADRANLLAEGDRFPQFEQRNVVVVAGAVKVFVPDDGRHSPHDRRRLSVGVLVVVAEHHLELGPAQPKAQKLHILVAACHIIINSHLRTQWAAVRT
jgi:hypothetical protein